MGIREPTSKLQFEPALLTPIKSSVQGQLEHGFVFIDAYDSSNIAIAQSDNSVYCFGEKQSRQNQDEVD